MNARFDFPLGARDSSRSIVVRAKRREFTRSRFIDARFNVPNVDRVPGKRPFPIQIAGVREEFEGRAPRSTKLKKARREDGSMMP